MRLRPSLTRHLGFACLLLAGGALAATMQLGSAGCAAPKGQCEINSDCPGGNYCTAGRCRYDCRYDFDCKTGVCESATGRCVAAGEGPADGGARDLRGVSARDASATPDLSDPPDLSPPLQLAYGDICAADDECESAICSKNPFAINERVCTGPCNQPCHVGDFCIAALSQCAQSDIGAPCNLAQQGQDCRGGSCLGGGRAPSYCTKACQSAAECPSGYSCSSLRAGGRYCVQVDITPPCASDADCWFDTYCDTARARCLGDCRGDADCPLWNKCKLLDQQPVCAPNKAEGAGGLGDSCVQGDECRAGFCELGACIGGCGVTAAVGQYCPGGWGCNPVDTHQGFYTLACLPAGQGALGAACVDNTGCASAVCVTDGAHRSYCSRFCNSDPCPATLPNCNPAGVVADGIALMACEK